MSLTAQKPSLDNSIKEALYNAAYQSTILTIDNNSNAASNIKTQLNSAIDSYAREFAAKFSETAYQPISQAIYDFVMAISINLTPKGTLISPSMGGPVTGTALETDFKVF